MGKRLRHTFRFALFVLLKTDATSLRLKVIVGCGLPQWAGLIDRRKRLGLQSERIRTPMPR